MMDVAISCTRKPRAGRCRDWGTCGQCAICRWELESRGGVSRMVTHHVSSCLGRMICLITHDASFLKVEVLGGKVEREGDCMRHTLRHALIRNTHLMREGKNGRERTCSVLRPQTPPALKPSESHRWVVDTVVQTIPSP